MAIGYNPSIPSSGLIFCLDAGNIKSYPGSGTTWTDISGNGNNGTLVNGVGYSSSNGGCLTFNGTNQYVTVPHNANIDFNTSTVIYVAQLSSSPNARNTVFSKYNGTGAQHEWGSSGYLRSNYRDASATTPELDAPNGTGQVNTNTIYHIAVTYGSKTIEHFKNGVSLGSLLNSTHNTVNNTINIGIGYNTSAGLYFAGNIYMVSIYNRVLSASEILQHYNVLGRRFGI